MKISIKVVPGAKQNEIAEDGFDDAGARILKIRVNQPPEDGKANKAAIELLAKYLKVKKSAVSIISGETSRNKIVEIDLD
ncbi:MAG: DUF167 domain-containing protein [Proteobacteria bacterium]|nr:DUF167 domain-containing protein [Pseudomonadota bacterium]